MAGDVFGVVQVVITGRVVLAINDVFAINLVVRVVYVLDAECDAPIDAVVLITTDVDVVVADIAFLVAYKEVVFAVVVISVTVIRVNGECVVEQIVNL